MLKKIKKISNKVLDKIDRFWDKVMGWEDDVEIDTSPTQFNKYFEEKVSKGLQGGKEMYTLAMQGGNGIPTIGKDHYFYGDINDAIEKRNRLQGSNKVRLEVRKVKVFIMEVK